MNRTTPVFLALLAIGCEGSTFQYSGNQMHTYFPLDGERSWEYVQEDPSFEWRMQVEKMSGSYDADGAEVFTLEYSKKDPFEILYSVDWSSDSSDGILIHGYHEEGSDAVAFDPPVVFAEYQMMNEDMVITDTGGLTFKSTLVGKDACPNEWTDEWECLHMHIEDGGAGLPFTGDYWTTTTWGVSWFQPTGYDEMWTLQSAVWNPDAE